MLTELLVKNLAIVSELNMSFADGMHVITGETGAGKSILMNALGMVLGERASPQQIRPGCERAEITACFNIQGHPKVRQKLLDQGFNLEENAALVELIIRRVITVSGSKAYLNGEPVTSQQLKIIAPYLLQIHSQHQQHELLDGDRQRQLLDAHGNYQDTLEQVKEVYTRYQKYKQELQQLQQAEQHSERLDLLNYQISEIEELGLQADELEQLNLRHKELSQADSIITTCSKIAGLINNDSDEPCINEQLQTVWQAFHELPSVVEQHPNLTNFKELINSAMITLQEADNEIQHYLSEINPDPEELQQVELRLQAIYDLSRKLRVEPRQLADLLQDLLKERDELINASSRLEYVNKQLQEAKLDFYEISRKLTQLRIKTAESLSKKITSKLKSLDLPHAKLSIAINANSNQEPSVHGLDTICFNVATNPGQNPGPLKKVASGGELSRISLAMQMIAASVMITPTLIFDEVDVGISGQTAATVGRALRSLSDNAQIICITHLPQVASQSKQHYKVTKKQTKTSTNTSITQLNTEQHIQEIARLVGGETITPEAIAHAESLVELA